MDKFLKIADQVSRFIVGGLFIFSGLIKLNDPIGTKIKMQEYFEVFADDFGSFFQWFVPIALPISMVVIVLEVVLGVAVLMFFKMQKTTVVLLLLMVFFTFLTGYSHFLDKVTDCGCFGDFIKLTPKTSFIKDLILLVFVGHLFWYRKKYQEVLTPGQGKMAVIGTTVICFLLGIYAVMHLPYFDFRPYKVGANIPEEMQPPEAAIFEYTFEKEGKEVTSQKYLSADEGYTYKSYHILNEENTIPAITDYGVFDGEGNDVTDLTFEGVKLLYVVQDVEHTDTEDMEDIQALIKNLDGKIKIMLLTSASAEEIEVYRHTHQLALPVYFLDATVAKTIIRSNPGWTLWVNGIVKGKWHHNDTPNAEDVMGLVK